MLTCCLPLLSSCSSNSLAALVPVSLHVIITQVIITLAEAGLTWLFVHHRSCLCIRRPSSHSQQLMVVVAAASAAAAALEPEVTTPLQLLNPMWRCRQQQLMRRELWLLLLLLPLLRLLPPLLLMRHLVLASAGVAQQHRPLARKLLIPHPWCPRLVQPPRC